MLNQDPYKEAQHIVHSDLETLLESSQNLDVLILTSSQGWCVAYVLNLFDDPKRQKNTQIFSQGIQD